MGNIDQWTLEAFKNVKSELLKMKDRRKEIPAEIKHRENYIMEFENDIKQLEQEREKLTAVQIEQQKRLNYVMNHPPKETSENQQDNERLRRNWTNTVQRLRKSIETVEAQLGIIKRKKEELQNRIQILEREISQLKEEDKKIVEECSNHLKEQRQVATEAEKAINEHTKSKEIFAKSQMVTRFGSDAAASGKQISGSIIRKYKEKKELSLMLALLALSIINNKDNDDAVNEASGTERTEGSVQAEDVMNSGYINRRSNETVEKSENEIQDTTSSRQQSFLETYGTSSVEIKPDGTTDFTKVSYVGGMKYSSDITSYDLDSYVGENKYHITAEEMEKFRRESGVVWRVEGEDVYLIPKAGEVCGSAQGFTLDEWNVSNNDGVKILKRDRYLMTNKLRRK